MVSQDQPTFELNNGQKIPTLGLGTYPVKDAEVFERAITLGYRHIDTAWFYQNETFVGEAIKNCIAKGIVKREELFITTKLWFTRFNEVDEAIADSLQRLGLDYVDLYLIHWPHNYHPDDPSKSCPMHVLYPRLEALVEKGQIKAIGLSNFNVQFMQDILTYAKVKPVCNQVQLFPYCAQPELVGFMQKYGIQPVAWSPTGRLNTQDGGPSYDATKEPIIVELSEKYQKTPAQIILNWNLSRGVVVIPKAASKVNQEANLEVTTFSLTPEEVAEITKLDKKSYLWPSHREDIPSIFA